MAQRITIRDIAEAAHSSITAVSLTLNDRPNRLSEATKEHIRDVAAQLHYVPNQSARNLVNRRSMLLGLIVPDIENTYFAKVSRRVSDEATKHGYTLIIANSNDSTGIGQRLLTQFEERGLDGAIIVPSLESFDHPGDFREAVERFSNPVMLLDRISALPWCDGVGFDNHEGGRIVARYLLGKGHRNVGIIGARSEYMDKDGRIGGFLEAMSDAGSPVATERIAEGNFRYEGGYKGIEQLLAQHVTAVFCGNDLTALGARKRILELGYKIPQDISLVGYDNSMAAQGIGADLTTVDQNIGQMAETSVNALVDRIRGLLASKLHPGQKKAETPADVGKPWLTQARQQMLQPQLIERETVAAVNA
ncbi:MAG: LacI family transcriptional regulator [Bifidobacteriaceae bacterium]|jgi:LacI family transcriptional regulator|nr:LacI family transcriptional regulator [Bifidobacteriaceae bacterium]